MMVVNFATLMLIMSGLARASWGPIVDIFHNDVVEKEVVTSNLESERKFIERYVDSEGEAFFGWGEIFDREDDVELKKFCKKAHEAAGMGKADIVDGFEGHGLLKFQNKSIKPATIALLTYVIEMPEDNKQEDDNHDPHHDPHHEHYRHTNDLNKRESMAPFQEVMHAKESTNSSYKDRFYFFITKGTRDDCVFYLDQVDDYHYNREFQLEDEVCGIPSLKYVQY